jgi:hypothetical protein
MEEERGARHGPSGGRGGTGVHPTTVRDVVGAALKRARGVDPAAVRGGGR